MISRATTSRKGFLQITMAMRQDGLSATFLDRLHSVLSRCPVDAVLPMALGVSANTNHNKYFHHSDGLNCE